jgi:hypothetical protein
MAAVELPKPHERDTRDAPQSSSLQEPAKASPGSAAPFAPTIPAAPSREPHAEPLKNDAAPAPARLPEEVAAETAKAPQALRSVAIDFSPDGTQDVRLRLTEKAGDVHISLHSTDPALTGHLSAGVHDLVGSLTNAGYDAQAWTSDQGRQHQRAFEDQRKPRRATTADAPSFDDVIQQPVKEIS